MPHQITQPPRDLCWILPGVGDVAWVERHPAAGWSISSIRSSACWPVAISAVLVELDGQVSPRLSASAANSRISAATPRATSYPGIGRRLGAGLDGDGIGPFT